MKKVLASGIVGFWVGGYEGAVVIDGDEDLIGVGFMLTVGADDGSSIRITFFLLQEQCLYLQRQFLR